MEWLYRILPWHKHGWVADKRFFGGPQGEAVYKLVCVKCGGYKMWSETDIQKRNEDKNHNKPLRYV